MSDLPYAAEADLAISMEELEYLEARYNAEVEQNSLTADTQFLYAWGLIRSGYTDDKKLGISLLHNIMKMFPDRSRECLYYLAVGYYRLENYSDAKKFAEVLLRHEPGNLQAKSLLDRINAQVAKEGVIGLALVGGAVAAIAGIAIAALRSRRDH